LKHFTLPQKHRLGLWMFGLCSLVLAMQFPMVTDEAYYVDWALRDPWPALGFFDHPPLVSWIASIARFWHDIRAARIVVWLINLISLWAVWKTCLKMIPNRPTQTIVMMATSIGGIAGGILLTPDTGLIALWNIAIHEALCALRSNPKRWITAGIATGLGLLSKYTMILIGPIFLWGLWRDKPKQLTTIWPYLGGLVCLCIFLPHLWWQSKNQWVTFRFQFGHGFSVKSSLQTDSLLPPAYEPQTADANEWLLRDQLFAAISGEGGFSEMIRKPKPQMSRFDKSVQYTGDYLGGVVALWGIYTLPLIGQLLKKRLKLRSGGRPEGLGLVTASAFFPLLFFGMIAPFSKIEANWPAMHMAGLAVWLSYRRPLSQRFISIAVLLHAIVIILFGIMMTWPELFPATRRNRLLLESKGYTSLGQYIASRFGQTPMAVDSYQLKSAIRYHSPQTPVVQWPGITRGSEYTRGTPQDKAVESRILNQSSVSILSLQPSPRVIEGYKAIRLEGLRICPDGTLGAFSVSYPSLPCVNGLREWWITTYIKTP
jgi:hypothetical protein